MLAASSDAQDRAEQAKSGWGLDNLRIGYGLAIDEARKWGLYISHSKGTTSTMPFGRPHFNEILQSLDFVISKDYPARGDA